VSPTNATQYEVFAVRFVSQETTRNNIFLRYGSYGERDQGVTCAYYYWVIRGAEGVILFDSGFNQRVADLHGHGKVEPIRLGLSALDITPDDVKLIVISHLHYDHVGNLEQFPGAEIAVQASEVQFWSSSMATRALFANLAEQEYLENLDRARSDGRVKLLEGDTQITQGVYAISLPGHTPGQEGLIVKTPEKSLVLASDALHFRAELDNDWPFMIVTDLVGMYGSFERLRTLSADGHIIVPGHDPEAIAEYETLRYGADGTIALLR
jgi:glyoxylase-like metal-dependent hydrolase (beta-lactamase superfamily II)